MTRFVCGVDIGGTFTDCALIADDGRVAHGKALSSPADSFQSGFFGSIAAAAEQLGVDPAALYADREAIVSHGSTVATNIAVERKGAQIGMLTTVGMEDTVRTMRGMGRATGEPPENLLRVAEVEKPEPFVRPDRVVGIPERIDSEGDVVVALDEDAVRAGVRRLLDDGVDAIAIAFMWSVRNPDHERRAREIALECDPDLFVTVSSDISKAVGEYERFVATLVNAFVGPVTSRYLSTLQDRLGEVGFANELHIMQCHGGMVPLSAGFDRPIFTIGSGPVGGLIGCARIAEQLGTGDLIASDMGGTSFDVGIVKDGEPLSADETVLGKFRYRIPALEVVSIGAGGGSIAWIDEHGGGLRVGPQSASSLPGPACYGRGGEEPTVTDADLVLGYIAPDASFGNSAERGFTPRRELAEEAIRSRIAEPLGLSLEDAALGIVEVANAKMASALENEIVGRGYDPRDFTLLSYGGAGPFHAAGYAATLGIDRIVVPGAAASVWSAFGISQADIRYQLEASLVMLEPFSADGLAARYRELEDEARELIGAEGEHAAGYEFRRFARMRFQWQMHELEVRVPDGELTDDAIAALAADFVRVYGERYGEAALLPGARLEIVSLRLEPALAMGSEQLDRDSEPSGTALIGARPLWFERGAGPVDGSIYDGHALAVGERVEGPAVIDLAITGIVVPPGARCERLDTGDFVLTLGLEENR